MRYLADLHIHSKYARACSDKLELPNMADAARTKGIGIMGTGDFTHPLWFKEIKSQLEASGDGLFTVKGKPETKFALSTEVSVIFNPKGGQVGIFSKDRDVKKVHNCILAPSIEVVEQINAVLGKHGDLSMDGRPSLLMSTPELVEKLMEIDKDIFIFPAHAWTPWFGVFGSMSGFDSIKEAYEDQAKHIYAIESGLSSDPGMNWRISGLDKYAIISCSDAHSLPKLAREGVMFDLPEGRTSYRSIIDAIKSKRMERTVEFYPEEGKYHYDGHRRCNISLSPKQAEKFNNICPVCRKTLTIGVLHRIEDLADREEGYRPAGAVPFVHAVPLQEVIAYVMKKGPETMGVKVLYAKLIEAFGTEMNVLLDASVGSIESIDPELAKAIENVREERVRITPGYDGVFGVLDLLGRERAPRNSSAQKSMSDFA